MKKQLITTIAIAASLLGEGPAHAVNTILQPDSVSSSSSNSLSPTNLINQSGLSQMYETGVNLFTDVVDIKTKDILCLILLIVI